MASKPVVICWIGTGSHAYWEIMYIIVLSKIFHENKKKHKVVNAPKAIGVLIEKKNCLKPSQGNSLKPSWDVCKASQNLLNSIIIDILSFRHKKTYFLRYLIGLLIYLNFSELPTIPFLRQPWYLAFSISISPLLFFHGELFKIYIRLKETT